MVVPLVIIHLYMGFSFINQPFRGSPISGNHHIIIISVYVHPRAPNFRDNRTSLIFKECSSVLMASISKQPLNKSGSSWTAEEMAIASGLRHFMGHDKICKGRTKKKQRCQ